MILFRLISFAIRLTMSFVFVALLQIQIPWNGRTLESYLSQWGQHIVGAPLLEEAGKKSAKAFQALSGAPQRALSQSLSPEPPAESAPPGGPQTGGPQTGGPQTGGAARGGAAR